MHASVDVHFEITIQDDKTVTLGTLAQSITARDIEQQLIEAVVESVDGQLTEQYCGEKHQPGNGEKRYQRAGTTTRTATTTAGEHELTLHQVKDHDEGSYFRPLEDAVTFDGQKHYQEDVSMAAVDLATKLSYRDAVTEGEQFTTMPSPSTINRRVIEYGDELAGFNEDALEGTEAPCVQADGTKCHSQEPDLNHNEITVTLDDSAEEARLLDVSVNDSWEETASELEEAEAIADEATIVSDADRELREAFVTEDRTQQLDLIHLVRTTGYYLWNDGEIDLEDRKAILDSVREGVYPLAAAVDWFREADADEAAESWLRDRIDETVDSLREVATNLSSLGCPKTARYLHRCSNRAVTFARLALEDVHVPWTSNRIERLMGEVSKRCKHQWMRWTSPGLEAILRLLLTRSTMESRYDRFRARITHQSDQTYISTEVIVKPARGTF